jgi:hypothetical protein
MVIFGITIFIIIFFPFYGLSLRFYVGYVLNKIFDTIGNFSLIMGGFLITLCVISLFIGKKIRVGWFIVAIVLLWVGCWCTGTILNLWGHIIGNSQNSGGGSGYY